MKTSNKSTSQTSTQKRKKSYTLLIIGAVLLLAAIIFTLYAYHTSYQESLEIAEALKEVKAEITAIEEGTIKGDLEALQAEKETLSQNKLSKERPYSYGLTALFLSILFVVKGLYNGLVGVSVSQTTKTNINRLAQAGLLAALCYIGFAFFKIDIPVGPEKTAFHFGNVFCVLAALLLGGYWGGMAGAIGMTIGDLTTSYVTSAPKTFLLKLCIGLIVGFVAHKIFKLSKPHSPKYITGVTILACACGMIFNIFADPLVGYFYKMYLLGIPQDIATVLAKWSAVTTSVNAVVAVIAASIFYLALRTPLMKAGLFVQFHKEDAKEENA
ncbi:MAG: ECF transporter S component [Lachnospiraceae bacterium]|nr:ECF transporter S component [Lachnospiraceae bacterium]